MGIRKCIYRSRLHVLEIYQTFLFISARLSERVAETSSLIILFNALNESLTGNAPTF